MILRWYIGNQHVKLTPPLIFKSVYTFDSTLFDRSQKKKKKKEKKKKSTALLGVWFILFSFERYKNIEWRRHCFSTGVWSSEHSHRSHSLLNAFISLAQLCHGLVSKSFFYKRNMDRSSLFWYSNQYLGVPSSVRLDFFDETAFHGVLACIWIPGVAS